MCLPRPPHIGVPLLARGKVYCKMFLSKLDSTTPVTCVVGGWRVAGSDRQVPDWCVIGEYHSLTQLSVWAYLDSQRARRALWREPGNSVKRETLNPPLWSRKL